MVVDHISEFLYFLIQFFLRPKLIQVGAFVLQGVEIPLHHRIIVGVSGLAHALGDLHGFAEIVKRF